MRREFVFLGIFLSSATYACAQHVIKGVVADEKGVGIEGAVVKVSEGNTIVGYSIAQKGGTFSVTFKTDKPQVLLSAEALGYASDKRQVKNISQTARLTLAGHSQKLKEVVVKAPSIYQRGDTLSFNLSSYRGKNDYTLKEAMRRLPGIEVGKTGTIKYLGKEISNFYINGLDMLGGKYNIATSNIPSAYVNTVQVLNNHQAVKANKDVFSDNVAINIKTSDRLKLKPVGTYSVAAGGGSGRALYEVTGTGMLFKPDFQLLVSLKTGNVRRFALEEETNHFESTASSPVSSLLGNIAGSTPPLELDRYSKPEDHLASVNMLKKTGTNTTLKANIGYGYDKGSYEYALKRNYFDAQQPVVISQKYTPLSSTHKPSVELEYMNNSPKNYIRNTLSATGSFLRADLPTEESGSGWRLSQKLREFKVSNRLSAFWNQQAWRWNVSSLLQYQGTPMGQIALNGDKKGNFTQQADGQSFSTKNTVTASLGHADSWFRLPLSLDYTQDHIRTSLYRGSTENDVTWQNLLIALAPQYEYTHPMRRFVFRTDVPVRMDWVDSDVDFTGKKLYFSVTPSLYSHYKLTSRATVRTDVRWSRSLGDIAQLLTAPVQVDELTRKIGSGLLADTKRFSATLHYDYTIPLRMWFFNADVQFNREKNNLLSSQEVSNTLLVSTMAGVPNTAMNVMGGISLTKFIEALKTKVSLSGSYLWKKQAMLQNNRLRDYYGTSWSVSPFISSRPFDFIEIEYKGDISRTYMRTADQRNSYRNQQHELSLKLNLWENLTVEGTADKVSNQLTEDVTKRMTMLDAAIVYRLKAWRIRLDLKNALNQRQYDYTLYNGINTYTYNYQLRGRECLCTMQLTI